MKKVISLIALMLMPLLGMAQKTVYIPQQTLKDEGYDPSTTRNNLNVPWCRYRSRESDNIIVFWAAGYGNNDPNSTAVPAEFRVDVDDMLAKLETFYDLNVNRLGFADLNNSNLSRYKMIICLYYTTEWMAYGGGFDDVIGGMWVSPSTCHPVGSTIAHEIGHSFQYQAFCDLHGAAGFRYNFGPNGCGYWETTANWQASMAYPDMMYSQSMYIYRQAYNTAMTHEWMRYQAYWMNYWWCDRHGIDMVGRLWRGATVWGDDVNQVYMKLMGLSTADLYREYMNAAMHFVTWDFNNADWKQRGSYFDIGNFVYNYVPVGTNEFQVAYSSCPQSTGYNVIPLDVPAAGTTISTHFTALPAGSPLADGDPRMFWNGAFMTPIATDTYNHFAGEAYRGFRLGYVALKRNGERIYQVEDKVYCTGTDEASADVSFTVPADVDRLWLVVSPALSQYIMHEWDENMLNDDQWPYRVKFSGTSIPGSQKYYLYDTASERFLSRGGAGGTQAVADEFGVPVQLVRQGNGVALQMLDNANGYVGGSGNLITTAGATTYYQEETADGVTFRNASGNYITINATTSNISLTSSQSAATHWKLLTSSQRNAILAQHSQKQDRETARQANIGLGTRSLASHAETDFTATDMTSRITNAALSNGTQGWTLQGTGAEAEAGAMEIYQGAGSAFSQTVNSLPKGLYRVSLHAFYRDGWPAACVGFSDTGFRQMSNAWLEANGIRVQIADWASQHSGEQYPNFRNEARDCFDRGLYRNDVYAFVGDDGRLSISFGTPQYVEGGWFCFADMTLTYYGMNDEYVPEYTHIEPNSVTGAERVLAAGKYYFVNLASGTFLTAAGNFGTQASLSSAGLDITLAYRQNGLYTFNTRISNGTNLNFLGQPETVGGPAYMDATAFNYAIAKTDDGYYTISYRGVSDEGDSRVFYLGYDPANPAVVSTRVLDPTTDNAQWMVMKRAELIDWFVSQAGQTDEPIDITSLVAAPNFSRNDQRNTTSWNGNPTIGGNDNNLCAEWFNNSFNVYQSLASLPAGNYRLTAQGFYRHGLPAPAYQAFASHTEADGPVLYANTASVPLVSIFSEATKAGFPANGAGRWITPSQGYTVPDDMIAASTAFSAGFYPNSLDFSLEEKGNVRIGFKKTAAGTPDGNWTIFDNVRLYLVSLPTPTGIEEINNEESGMKNGAIYDLQGRRVADHLQPTLPKGIYIVGGRKMLIR